MTTIKLQDGPDDIRTPGSQTFFYLPDTNKLYVEGYPITHRDMMESDPELFEDVWKAQNIKIEDAEPKHFSRGIVVANTKASLGRIGIHSKTGPKIVIAFWKALPQQELGHFFKALFAKFPTFAEQTANISVVLGHEDYGGDGIVRDFAEIFGNDVNTDVTYTRPKELTGPADNPYESKFEIDGKRYSLSDIRQLRSSQHMGDNSGMNVLCHPDLAKYPELKGYRPAACNGEHSVPNHGPSAWRRAAREKGMPYVYSYGECTFRNWIAFQDIFHA